MTWGAVTIEVSDPSPLSEGQVEWIERWAEEELRSEVMDCGYPNCRLCQRETQVMNARSIYV